MKRSYTVIVIFAICVSVIAQAPNAFNYQAILRNSDGTVKDNETVALQISLVDETGLSVYLEIHNSQTNDFGLVNLVIGEGETSDDLTQVDWSAGPYFIDISVNGVNLGSSPLLSVPYAIHANTAETLLNPQIESDPVYSSSISSVITNSDISNWNNKLDSFTEIQTLTNILDLGNNGNGNQIKNIADPTEDQDVVTKSFVSWRVSTEGDTLFMGPNQWVIIPGISAANAEEGNKIADIDGNEYGILTIGSQKWLDKNLKTTKYSDGTDIPLEESSFIWEGLTGPAYCWYDNDQSSLGDIYGALYNWYAVNTTTSWGKNVCPTGWHVPLDEEWTTLINFVGGQIIAGGKLKESALDHWMSPNEGAINEFGFTALPGGRRYTDGTFDLIGKIGCWWTSTESDIDMAWGRQLSYNNTWATKYGLGKVAGFSIRCIKD